MNVSNTSFGIKFNVKAKQQCAETKNSKHTNTH